MSTDIKVYGVVSHPSGAWEKFYPLKDVQDGKTWLQRAFTRNESPIELKLMRTRYFRGDTYPTEEVISIWKK